MGEIATKRIPVTPDTWEKLSELKKPGETFDALIDQMITHEQQIRLFADIKRIEDRGNYIPFDTFKAELEGA